MCFACYRVCELFVECVCYLIRCCCCFVVEGDCVVFWLGGFFVRETTDGFPKCVSVCLVVPCFV